MKVSTENDNNFGYEKITILVDNIPLSNQKFKLPVIISLIYFKLFCEICDFDNVLLKFNGFC